MEIILASASPRRRELMARVWPEFRVYPVDVDESAVAERDPLKFAVAAAVLKAKSAAETFPGDTIIGADTVVALGLRILGKPSDRESARAMLQALSGRRHRVITGLAFYHKAEGRLLTGYGLTHVTFRPLTAEMIDGYLGQNDFLDKAGAYAVQDIGDAFVRRLEGDFDNVVGFPVREARRLLGLFQSPPLAVTVEDTDFPDSAGRAAVDGRTLLIPGAVPGDTVLVQVVGERGNSKIADVLRVQSPSPFRAKPSCPHFGPCGGCLFQHLDYAKQLEFKERHLRRAFESAGAAEWSAAIEPVSPSPSLSFYRNKMEFAFGGDEGRLSLGLRERDASRRKTHRRTLPLGECPIFSPIVGRVFPVVLDFARERGLSAFDPLTGNGDLRHLILRQAKRTGELMAVLVTARRLEPDWGDLADRWVSAAPELKSFYHVANRRASDVVEFERTTLVAGAPFIEERIAGLVFRIYPQTFFQTNTEGAELLYRRIQDRAPLSPGTRVLGLYCGSGPIEISLASAVGKATGIDSSPANIANAVENALVNGIENVDFVPGTVESLLRDPLREPADVLVLDPPRAGLSAKALRRVLALGVPSVVYVSCNPASLARDLREFGRVGYRVGSLSPIDFFPHTPHLEILAVLTR